MLHPSSPAELRGERLSSPSNGSYWYGFRTPSPAISFTAELELLPLNEYLLYSKPKLPGLTLDWLELSQIPVLPPLVMHA